MTPIFHTFLFFIALSLILGAGYVVWRLFFVAQESYLRIEALLFSFVLGITLVDFSMIAIGRAGIPLGSIVIALTLLIPIAAGIAYRKRFHPRAPLLDERHVLPLTRSKRHRTLFILLFALTLGIKTLYLSDAIVPTATDLGHHLYWAKTIVETQALPDYRESEVIDEPGNIHIAEPAPIADFIIGEHLPIAAIAFLTGENFFSAFPIVFLLIINIMSLFALVVLAYRLVDGSSLKRLVSPELAALSALFLFGPLYTLASPQAKFVSGGVIGNIFGNLFIPIILLLFLRAFQEKNPRLLGLGFVFTFALAYTHHLSTLILLYALAGIGALVVASHLGSLRSLGRDIIATCLKPVPLIVAGIALCFFFLVAMPTYIETHAVGTALGTPTKVTRIGLSFDQITSTAGEARFAIGIVGLILAAMIFRRSLTASLLLGWTGMLFLMAYRPDWLFLNIPSNRIGTYFSFPMGIAASIGLAWLIILAARQKRHPLALPLVSIMFVFTIASGFSDNGQSLLTAPKSAEAIETFAASRYLAYRTDADDVVLKDHNYIVADAWMKHFFMRDYFFPLSRGYFGRYESSDRERCTLDMIAIPNTPRGQECFDGTGTNYVIVNPRFDAPQFEKSTGFSRVYASDKIHIYAR